MKRFLLLFAFPLVVAVICSCTKPADAAGGFDWPRWRGPDGNGQSRETEWNPAAIAESRIIWKTDLGDGYANIVIQAGRLYAVGMTQGKLAVHCLEAATGRKIWRKEYVTYSPPQATPCVAGDDLIVLSTEGYLYAIDARNGAQRWRKDLVADFGAQRPSYNFAGSPMIEGDLVILTANTSGMAVQRATGELAWTSDKPPKNFRSADRQNSTGTGYSTPVLFDGPTGRQALMLGWDGITAVDAKTGRRSWHLPWNMEPGGSSVDPVIAGDTICVALAYDVSARQSGLLLDASESEPRISWRTSELFAFLGYPLIIGGEIYSVYGGPNVLSMRMPTSLRCYDLASGQLLWTEPFGSNRTNKSFSLAAANGVLIILDDRGTLYTAEASREGYREIARCDVLQGENRPRLFWSPPVLCNAKIYCRNFSGDLVCIDVSR